MTPDGVEIYRHFCYTFYTKTVIFKRHRSYKLSIIRLYTIITAKMFFIPKILKNLNLILYYNTIGDQ